MNTNSPKTYPSAGVTVRLLQGALYSEDEEQWAAMMRYRSHIESYFAEIGLQLVVHEEDGFAYLAQAELEQGTDLPRLVRRDKLSKGIAIVGVVLRERLLQFDAAIHDESRLILSKDEIVQLVSPFYPESNDQPRGDKRIEAAISKAEDLGLLRKLLNANEDRYEVRRVIKARFPVETLKVLREQLEKHANGDERQQ